MVLLFFFWHVFSLNFLRESAKKSISKFIFVENLLVCIKFSLIVPNSHCTLYSYHQWYLCVSLQCFQDFSTKDSFFHFSHGQLIFVIVYFLIKNFGIKAVCQTVVHPELSRDHRCELIEFIHLHFL